MKQNFLTATYKHIKNLCFQELEWHSNYVKDSFERKRSWVTKLIHLDIYIVLLLPARYITCNTYLDTWFPLLFGVSTFFFPKLAPLWYLYVTLLTETTLFSWIYHRNAPFQEWFDTLIGGKKTVTFFLGNPGSASARSLILSGTGVAGAAIAYHLNDLLEHKKAVLREQDAIELTRKRVEILVQGLGGDISLEQHKSLYQETLQDVRRTLQPVTKTNVSVAADMNQGTVDANFEHQAKHTGFAAKGLVNTLPKPDQ